MHRVLAFLLALVVGGTFAAEPTQPPADGAATTEAPGVAPTKEALKQGFDYHYTSRPRPGVLTTDRKFFTALVVTVK